MAIRDTDGTIYRLHGPNPIMKEQELWDDSQITLINLSWTGQTVVDPNNPVAAARAKVRNIDARVKPKPKSSRSVPVREFIKEVAKPVPETSKAPEPPKPPEPVVLNVEPDVAKVLQDRGRTFFCAPANGFQEQVDPLYGTTTRSKVYGEKFIFDAIIIDQSDLQLQFWAMKALPPGSIVYQKAKDGEWERRWWEVSGSEPKSGGHLNLCNISTLNPDFS